MISAIMELFYHVYSLLWLYTLLATEKLTLRFIKSVNARGFHAKLCNWKQSLRVCIPRLSREGYFFYIIIGED
ncbi:MAG TPA: hypothetical protein DCS91_22050 [Microcoleaceae bacterium UBA11344]|nr:hypothetical protein [Microcoleaceae cyanobacterium UBA11344]